MAINEEITKVAVSICGCDDTTELTIEANKDELAFLDKLSKLSIENSTCQCKPIIEYMLESDQEDWEEFRNIVNHGSHVMGGE